MPDETKTTPPAAPSAKPTASPIKAADRGDGLQDAVATLQARELADGIEVAIVEGLVERSLCGRDADRVEDLADYGRRLVDDIKATLAYYRGETKE